MVIAFGMDHLSTKEATFAKQEEHICKAGTAQGLVRLQAGNGMGKKPAAIITLILIL